MTTKEGKAKSSKLRLAAVNGQEVIPTLFDTPPGLPVNPAEPKPFMPYKHITLAEGLASFSRAAGSEPHDDDDIADEDSLTEEQEELLLMWADSSLDAEKLSKMSDAILDTTYSMVMADLELVQAELLSRKKS